MANGISVLVVEDEGLIRMSVVDDLSDAGFRVLEAANAEEAFAILQANPDLTALFTDIDMPGGLDGLDLARLAQRSNPDVAIIMTSGYLKIPKCDLPGQTPFFSKPYEIKSVINHIRSLTVR